MLQIMNKNQFTVYIEASDNDGSGSTTVSFFSSVTNLNDNSPIFHQALHTILMKMKLQ